MADEGSVGTSTSSSDNDYLIVVWVFVGLFIGVLILGLIITGFRLDRLYTLFCFGELPTLQSEV